MSIFGKLRSLTGKGEPAAAPPPPPDPETEPLAALDHVIDELERVRADAAQVMIRSSEGDRSALQASLRTLEAKLDEARNKRKGLSARLERTDRRRALTAELTALRLELEGLDDAARGGARGVAIRDRFTEIKIEVAALAAAAKGG